MKRFRIKTLTIAVIFALSLSTGGIIAGAQYNPEDEMIVDIPSFTNHPRSQTVTVGQDVVFSVTVSENMNPSIKWQVSADDGATWSDTGGQTRQANTTLRLNAVTSSMNGNQYRAVITGFDIEIISAAAVLSVNTTSNAHTPIITEQPTDRSVLPNTSITLSVAANVTDQGTLSFQWFSNTVDRNSGGTLIRGADSRTFNPPTSEVGTMFYYAVVTNTNNNASGNITATATSTTAKVVINALINAQTPEIINQPENVTVTVGNDITLYVNARIRDNGTLTYQWFRYDTTAGTGSTPIRDATGAVFSPDTDTVGVVFYSVVITNTNSNVNGSETAAVASRVVSVEVIDTPDAPMNLNTIVSENQVILTWDTPENIGGSEIIGYQVSDNIVTLWIEANGENMHTFEGLGDDREYTFKVRAVNAAGHGETAEITVTTLEREIINVTGISSDPKLVNLQVGEYMTLSFTIAPENASNQSVTWSSHDTSVAVVDANGTVTGLAAGSALITVTTVDGRHTASSLITVEGSESGNGLLWIGLGVLAPIGTGTGIYFWKKKR